MTLADRVELRDRARAERLRSRRQALGAVAVVAVAGALIGLALGGEHGWSVTAILLTAVPVVVAVLAAVMAFGAMKRVDREPPLVLGADRATQRAVERALRDGRADDPRIDALARDSAERAGRRMWLFWLLAAGMAVQVTSVVHRLASDDGDWLLVGAAAVTAMAFGALCFTLVRHRRRARRYLTS